jgi:predicted nucleic acid-binding protein
MKNLDKTLYFDTSALLPYYRLEVLTHNVQAVLNATKSEVFINDLTEVEFASAVARWVRMNEATEAEALAIQHKFAEHKVLGYYTYQPLSISDFKQAKDWLLQRKTALRTLDALHLAFAARMKAVLVTAEKHLGQAAKEFGVRYQLLIARTH